MQSKTLVKARVQIHVEVQDQFRQGGCAKKEKQNKLVIAATVSEEPGLSISISKAWGIVVDGTIVTNQVPTYQMEECFTA